METHPSVRLGASRSLACIRLGWSRLQVRWARVLKGLPSVQIGIAVLGNAVGALTLNQRQGCRRIRINKRDVVAYWKQPYCTIQYPCVDRSPRRDYVVFPCMPCLASAAPAAWNRRGWGLAASCRTRWVTTARIRNRDFKERSKVFLV